MLMRIMLLPKSNGKAKDINSKRPKMAGELRWGSVMGEGEGRVTSISNWDICSNR